MGLSLKNIAKATIKRLGYDIIAQCEGFDRYLAAANKMGVDVNDWLENERGWEPALPSLNEILFPYLNDNMCVCEIGPGTGRHARHIIPLIRHGEMHLFDHSIWLQNFLRDYFIKYRNVVVHKCDGLTLDMPDASTDMVFSNGTLIAMKLGTIYLQAKEFARILKTGGLVIFDYIDISTEEGWLFLETQYRKLHHVYTYHCGHTIDQLFTNLGFTLVKRHQDGKSTYVVFRKND